MSTTSNHSNRSLSSESSQTNANQRRRHHRSKMALLLVLGVLSIILLGVIVYCVAKAYSSSAQESKQTIHRDESDTQPEERAIHMRIPSDQGPPRVSTSEQRSLNNPLWALQQATRQTQQRLRGLQQQQQQQVPRRNTISMVRGPTHPPLHSLWNNEVRCENFYQAVCGGPQQAADRPNKQISGYTAEWKQTFKLWLEIESFSPRMRSSRAMRIILNLYNQCGALVLKRLQKDHHLAVFRLYLAYTSAQNSATIQDEIKYAKLLIKRIRNSFDSMLENATYYPKMDPGTRERLRYKLSKMTPLVGYPDFVLNDLVLDGFYQDIPERELINDCNSTYERYTNRYRERVHASPDALHRKWAFGSYLGGSIASYNIIHNAIGVSFMYLQRPLFTLTYPSVLNYAILGTTVAHEITHGFDDVGCEYNSKGELVPMCSLGVKQWFDKQAICFKTQYTGYRFPAPFGNVESDGEQTLSENIADNGAIRIAHKAFIAHQDAIRAAAQRREPRLNYPENDRHTTGQLFFITYARKWCIEPSEKYLKKIVTDKHSLAWLRVNLVLQNYEAFRNAFGCTEGVDFMAPLERCELW